MGDATPAAPPCQRAGDRPAMIPPRMRRHLFLLKELVKRDFQGRYAGSALGFFWSFVQPLWLLGLYWFVFGEVLEVAPGGQARTESFALFLFAGLLPWTAIHEGVLRGTTAVTDNAALVKKLSFRSELLVLAIVLAALLHEAIALCVFVAVLAAFGELVPASLGWLLLAVPVQAALTLGLGLLLAAVNVFFRDVAQVLGLVLNAWFFLTPIVYPLEWVPEAMRPALEANPLTALVALYRRALIGGELPGTALVALLVVAALVLAAGLALFARLRPSFVDEI
jgi:lipopolysaccharide transport system permease protein